MTSRSDILICIAYTTIGSNKNSDAKFNPFPKVKRKIQTPFPDSSSSFSIGKTRLMTTRGDYSHTGSPVHVPYKLKEVLIVSTTTNEFAYTHLPSEIDFKSSLRKLNKTVMCCY